MGRRRACRELAQTRVRFGYRRLRDADLLDLNPFRGIAILAPAAYVDRQTTNGT